MSKKKVKKSISRSIVHIQATFNNTVVSISDINGDVVVWASSGSVGNKGSRKSTSFAAQKACESACEKAKKLGLKEVDIRIKGPGQGREQALQAVQNSGIKVRSIEDVTPLPHNGCRPSKRRRV
jgi:small subunit ribosomal protein S11